MSRHHHYVSVSGVTTPAEVDAVCAAYAAAFGPFTLVRRPGLALGFLASMKTCTGGEINARSANPADLHSLTALAQGRGRGRRLHGVSPLCVLHYFAKDAEQAGVDAWARTCATVQHALASSRCEALQLNSRTLPSVENVAALRAAVGSRRLILQVAGRGTLDGAPSAVLAAIADRLAGYAPLVNDVLLDGSGGAGVCLSPRPIAAVVHALRARCPDLGIGVAGGLTATPETPWIVGHILSFPVGSRIRVTSLPLPGEACVCVVASCTPDRGFFNVGVYPASKASGP